MSEEEANRRLNIMEEVFKYAEANYGEPEAMTIMEKLAYYFASEKYNPTILKGIEMVDKIAMLRRTLKNA